MAGIHKRVAENTEIVDKTHVAATMGRVVVVVARLVVTGRNGERAEVCQS